MENAVDTNRLKQYWRRNLTYLSVLLILWFLCSYGAGILFASWLNQFKFGGFKLGFWFAQQGAIFCFVGIIYGYVYLMNSLDKEFEVDEQ